MYVCMYGQMDGHKDGWAVRRTDDRCMNGR